MDYFPVCLDIRGRFCVVIGGGRVAERKVGGLLACGAKVTVVSPELTAGLQVLVSDGQLIWVDRAYREGDLASAFLVIAATDDTLVQAKVHAEAEKHNLLLNVADVPKWCNFILPATVRQGDLTVSVSTGGKSPALARQLREELEKHFGPEYGVLLKILGELRPDVLALGRPHAENKALFARLLHPEMLAWIRNRNWDALEGHVRATLGGDEVALSGVEKVKSMFGPDQQA